MPRPSRARRILKWTGVGLCVLIFGAWCLSLWSYAQVPIGNVVVVGFSNGFLIYTSGRNLNSFIQSPFIVAKSWDGFGLDKPKYFNLPSSGEYSIWIPFWTLLFAAAIPTAWLWHRDRRLFSSPPDHLFCRGCGYDLTGNLSGVCPECRDKVQNAGKNDNGE